MVCEACESCIKFLDIGAEALWIWFSSVAPRWRAAVARASEYVTWCTVCKHDKHPYKLSRQPILNFILFWSYYIVPWRSMDGHKEEVVYVSLLRCNAANYTSGLSSQHWRWIHKLTNTFCEKICIARASRSCLEDRYKTVHAHTMGFSTPVSTDHMLFKIRHHFGGDKFYAAKDRRQEPSLISPSEVFTWPPPCLLQVLKLVIYQPIHRLIEINWGRSMAI